MVKKLFIAATGQNVGKTTFSLGLLRVLKKKGLKVGFIKPIGQRYVVVDGCNVDEDSLLIKKACDMNQDLRFLSPIAVERGFSEKYILNPAKNPIKEKVKQAFERVSKGKDIVIIEGTGHSGVGSVFDMSNADMASFLDAKVLIVADAGIGNTIDKLVLNKSLYDNKNVEICGVVINKVINEKYDKIKKILPKGLERKGLKEFGLIPFKKKLSNPSLEQFRLFLDGESLTDADLSKSVGRFVVGAMAVHNALDFFKEKTVIITPGDRDDIILGALSKYYIKSQENLDTLSGIIVTGGLKPQETILKLVRKIGVPMILTKLDTYTTASKIHNLIVKIMPFDSQKIEETEKLVEKYVDVNNLLDSI